MPDPVPNNERYMHFSLGSSSSSAAAASGAPAAKKSRVDGAAEVDEFGIPLKFNLRDLGPHLGDGYKSEWQTTGRCVFPASATISEAVNMAWTRWFGDTIERKRRDTER